MMYEYAAELVRVIDGDTVVLDIDLGCHVTIRETIRLADINAPEIRGSLAFAGVQSTLHLRELIGNDSPLWIRTFEDKQGKYGRYIATIYGASGESLNTRMVQDGYAVAVEYD